MLLFISVALGASMLVLLGIYFWDKDNRETFMLKLKKLLKLRK